MEEMGTDVGKRRVSASEPAEDVMKSLDPGNLVSGLREEVQLRFRALLMLLAYTGFGRIRVTSGLRSLDSQCCIYGQGRSAAELARVGVASIYARPKLLKRSWIEPSESSHVLGRAIDIDLVFYESSVYKVLGYVAKSLGITWGGDWKVKDYGHFEY